MTGRVTCGAEFVTALADMSWLMTGSCKIDAGKTWEIEWPKRKNPAMTGLAAPVRRTRMESAFEMFDSRGNPTRVCGVFSEAG